MHEVITNCQTPSSESRRSGKISGNIKSANTGNLSRGFGLKSVGCFGKSNTNNKGSRRSRSEARTSNVKLENGTAINRRSRKLRKRGRGTIVKNFNTIKGIFGTDKSAGKLKNRSFGRTDRNRFMSASRNNVAWILNAI